MRLLRRLRALFRRDRLDAEMAEELRAHLDLQTAENIARGLSPADARHAALRAFGGVEQIKERARDQRKFGLLEDLVQDTRHAARALRRVPGFTAVVVLTLALGIGANTAIFSVCNAVLLKPLPYRDPGRLVQLRLDRPGRPDTNIGSPTFVAVKTRSRSFARIAAYCGGDLSLTGNGPAERIEAGAVTADFFPLLGVQPLLGRSFTREEDRPRGPRAVILGHGLWQSRFGGAADILGRTITLNGQHYPVVGILPADFRYSEPFQLWIPLALDDTGTGGGSPLASYGEGMIRLKAIARLQPGVSLEAARTEVRALAPPVPPGRPREAAPAGSPRADGAGDSVLTLVGLHEQVVGEVKGALVVLLGAVAFVLLIACANVANLMVARAAARQRELAIRTALGAGRRRIVRALLAESLLLALAGGGSGLLLVTWGLGAIDRWSGSALPTLHAITLDARVLAFTLGVSVLTGVLFGLAPAVQTWRTDVNGALKGTGRDRFGAHRSRLRHLLVVAEVALALVLVVGAGLLTKSLARLLAVDPGFRAEGVLTFQVNLAGERSRSGARTADFIEQLAARLQALPGVEAIAATDSLPLTPASRIAVVEIEGRPPPDWSRMKPGQITPVSRPTVTLDYFRAMGIPVRGGRSFVPDDLRSPAGAVIVNGVFARHYFPGESAVGKRLRLRAGRGEARWQTIVGVVGDVRQNGLAGDIMPEVYSPVLADTGGGLSFVIRATGEPASLTAAVRAAVTAVDPGQPPFNVTPMAQRLADTTVSQRLNTALLGSFAALALVLAAVGIYGVLSYAVTQRRREIGVRLALGAQKADVLRLMIGGGLRLTVAGVALGLAGAFALTRYLSAQLFGVTATDPATFAGVAALLLATALFACWLPAHRAAQVDPLVALRSE